MGYSKTVVKGITWITLLRLITRILTFIRLAVLGRLLSPIQFGYFGIASLLLSLLEILTETGINVFLVQEKANIKEYINSAWVVSILRGIILSILILITAPFIALFFNTYESTSIIALISIVPLIRGLINPSIVIYQKELIFEKEFRFRFILFLVDVVISITAGIITKNAVSFIYGLIASSLVEVILSYVLFPVWPKLKWEFKKIKLIFNRGKWVTLTGIFSFFADNGDNFAVGKILGSGSLGIYQIAYKFSTLPISEITQVINQVIFPVYSKFADDKTRLWKAFKKVTLLNIFGALLLGGFIYYFAEPLILFVMGKQWVSAVPVIKILSIYGILRTSFGSFSALFLSIGKQEFVAKMTLIRVIALLISIIPLVTYYGMIGAGYAMLLSIIVEIPFILYFTFMVFYKK